MTPEQKEAQRQQAFVSIKRLYRESLPLWTRCRRGACRRRCSAEQRSMKEAQLCLTRGRPNFSEAARDNAYAQVQSGGPSRRPPVTVMVREPRHYPPSNFVGR